MALGLTVANGLHIDKKEALEHHHHHDEDTQDDINDSPMAQILIEEKPTDVMNL